MSDLPLSVRMVAERRYPSSSLLFQSAFWARFKQHFGWEPRYFVVAEHGYERPLLVLMRKLPLFGTLAYVPHGPEWLPPDRDRPQWLIRLAARLWPFLPQDTLCLRFDPPWQVIATALEDSASADSAPVVSNSPSASVTPATLAGRGLHRHALRKRRLEIQPAHTIVIGLRPSETALLSAMKSKTRYNIRLAERKGVTVRRASRDMLPVWYQLYQQTAHRDGIVIHSFDYYDTLFGLLHQQTVNDAALEAPVIELLLAEHDGEALAGIIIALWGAQAIYLYGASADHKRNFMAPYALQWHGIRLARDAGCHSYDLFGIPPAADSNHPLHGLYRFKTGFGGQQVDRGGIHDWSQRPFRYAIWHLAEELRSIYFKRLRR